MRTARLPAWSIMVTLLVTLFAGSAGAQKKKKKPPAPALPKLRFQRLTTADGVHLRCALYESPQAKTQGKQIFPMVLVHGFGRGGASDFHYLAQGLQSLGFSVFVPDLRGHGKSLVRTLANGAQVEISRQRMKPKDKASMMLDLQAVKGFLMAENNAGRLNIEKLCVVGAGEGAILALHWAAYDWSQKDLPAFEVGKDIRGLILLSPPKTFARFNAQVALQQPFVLRRMPILIAVGQGDSAATKDAESLYKRIDGRRKAQAGNAPTGVFVSTANTELQGTDLLNPRLKLPITKGIVDFMKRMRSQSDRFPTWDEKRPFQ